VVAEYYPRAADPVRGVWTHRQALAARAAGAEVRVLVLHRPLPPLQSIRRREYRSAVAALRQPRSSELDGLQIDYVHYLSPPRPWSYASWGAWAAPALALRLRRIRRSFPFDLIHAHYAVPAGDAVRRAAPLAPLVVSVHGHDVYGDVARRGTVRASLAHARLVLANSAGTARRSAEHGARRTCVVHLGADIPPGPRHAPAAPTLVTVANLISRKRHADVIAAVARLHHKHPDLRYVIVGDGPERERLRALAVSSGVGDLVELRGSLPHEQAVAVARSASLFVLPSVEEAFGVAYVEAMAAGVPALGCRGEDGPEEIAAAGGGIALVPPGDVDALAERIGALLADPTALEALSQDARATVEREFTWDRCGRHTLQAYIDVLDSAHAPGESRRAFSQA
jgi:teichuronic acid biosynthesis glycosyltransferase TuaC